MTYSRALGVLPLFLFAACGGIDDLDGEPLAASEQALFDGTATTAYPEVFQIEHDGTFCTGVLVAPHVVMTAATCMGADMTTSGANQSCNEYTAPATLPDVTIGTDLTDVAPSALPKATAVAVPPTGLCHNAVTLLVLDKTIPSSFATPRDVRTDLVTAGDSFTAVAHGATADGSNSYAKTSVAGTVDCVNTACGAPWLDGDQAQFQSADMGVCSGDAGGPALDANGDVAGLVWGGGCDADGPSRFFHVPRFADWVATTIASWPEPSDVFDPTAGTGGAGGEGGAGGMGGSDPGTGGGGGVPIGEGGADTGGGAGGSDGSGEPLHATSDDDGGCAVSAAGSRSSSPAGLVALMMGALMTLRRRRNG